jgi:hypothetical protein
MILFIFSLYIEVYYDIIVMTRMKIIQIIACNNCDGFQHPQLHIFRKYKRLNIKRII